ncbi:hypothetical protein L1887_62890 [Cichorium endivia]|nr:hypothetical protein L1887_62890 [Cichorium endivia]
MSRFRPINREIDYLLPPSVQDWLPESHLARYVVEVVEGLDLSKLESVLCGPWQRCLPSGYVAVVADLRLCHGTRITTPLASFRRRHGEQFAATFVQVLQIARENQVSRFGTVSLDGTKIHANASRHSALSYAHAEKIEAQLKAEVQEMLKLAEAADQSDLPDGVSLPDEIKRREDRLAAIAEAKTKIEARAKERLEREQAEYQAKLDKREAKEKANGKKPGGKPPKPPQVGPRPDDQINLTDEESRIMKVAGGGFEQCYNAQALVDSESMLVMAPHVTQAGNDKEQVVPMLAKLQALPEELNQPEKFLADSGYFSEKNVEACEAARIEPLIAVGRDAHHRHWRERFEEPAASSEPDQSGRQNEAPTQDQGRARGLWAAQADGGTGIRNHQVGDGLPSVPAARVWRMSRTNGPWCAWRGT